MHILHLDASILGQYSVSRQLTAAVVTRLRELTPEATVTYHDLGENPPLHLSPAHMAAMQGAPVTDPAITADSLRCAPFITDLFAADVLVIGAPMYNFTLPTQLKAWIDRILVAGKTFRYGPSGVPEGLVPAAKKVIIVSSRGGSYGPDSPIAFLDHQERLLTSSLAFIGLQNVVVIRAEGVAIGPEARAAAIKTALADIERLV